MLGNWFGYQERGLVMAAWATSWALGNILGYQIGALMIERMGTGWEKVMQIVSYCLFGMAIIILCFLEPFPDWSADSDLG